MLLGPLPRRASRLAFRIEKPPPRSCPSCHISKPRTPIPQSPYCLLRRWCSQRGPQWRGAARWWSVRTMSGGGKVVCVTDASGYIASLLVKLLLEKRYTVKATIHDVGKTTSTAKLHVGVRAPLDSQAGDSLSKLLWHHVDAIIF